MATMIFLMIVGALTLTSILLTGILFLEAVGKFFGQVVGRVEVYQNHNAKQRAWGARLLKDGKR